MNILGIETSCDETAVAVLSAGVDTGISVKVSHVYSQIETHKVFGGVVPEIAAREHLKALDPLVRKTLSDAAMTIDCIDAIAVTQGPGLIGALLVGVSYAKGLALSSGKPLIPVNHVHAHVHGALLTVKEPRFPCLALVASGGHTNIYYMASPVSFEPMAHTLDDACGECFDKVAKHYGLGYPGGPEVEKLARQGQRDAFKMPKMLADVEQLKFSYSGLKTYMVNLKTKMQSQMSLSLLSDIMAGFQEEALGQLVRKIYLALQKRPETKMILVAGGVAANARFRELMKNSVGQLVHFPDLAYCSDNAAMIAAMGYYQLESSSSQDEIWYNLDWDPYSRYPYEA